jgi:hypothetical protein
LPLQLPGDAMHRALADAGSIFELQHDSGEKFGSALGRDGQG